MAQLVSLMSSCHYVFRLLPAHLFRQTSFFLFHLVFVSGGSGDLPRCLIMWAGLRVFWPSPPTTTFLLFGLIGRATTPALRLQKPCLQLLRKCQPVRVFPLVGRTHRHTAVLSLLANFLSNFALLSFSFFFTFHFSHSASFMAPFFSGITLFPSSHCSLVLVPSIAFLFLHHLFSLCFNLSHEPLLAWVLQLHTERPVTSPL